MYRDGTACANDWREWDKFCAECKGVGDDGLCEDIEQDYADAVNGKDEEESEDGLGEIAPGVAYPDVTCFYQEAYFYNEESDCTDKWRAFDTFCQGTDDNNLKELCNVIYDAYDEHTSLLALSS